MPESQPPEAATPKPSLLRQKIGEWFQDAEGKGGKQAKEQHWKLAESAFLWGAVGIVAGSAVSLTGAYFLGWEFTLAWFAVAVACIRHCFQHKNPGLRIIANILVLAFVGAGLFGFHHEVIKHIPAPPPIPPTADAVAEASVRTLCKDYPGYCRKAGDDAVEDPKKAEALLRGALKGQKDGVEPPAIQRMTNQQLRDNVVEFANEMRRYKSEYDQGQETVTIQMEQEINRLQESNAPSDQIQQANQKLIEHVRRSSTEEDAYIQTAFVGRALEFRKELERRLGPQPMTDEEVHLSFWYAGGTFHLGSFNLQVMANYFDRLARELPR